MAHPAPPSEHLLGPGQSWTIIQAPGWITPSGGDCTFMPGGSEHGLCRRPAVIEKLFEGAVSRLEQLCEQHMGSYRWIEEGVVMQWRADPAWRYKRYTPTLPPRKR